VRDQLYCDVDGCDDPQNPGFARPAFRNGKCSSHMKQLQRTGETKPIVERLPLNEQLIDAYSAYAEADSDEDEAVCKRRFFALTKQVAWREVGRAVSEALRRRQAEGKPVGRALKAEREQVLIDFAKAVDAVGDVKMAAEVTARFHRISRRTVFRYLSVTKTSLLSPAPGEARPRRAG
jgi:hypothetical protein